MVTLRVAALLAERGWNARDLADRSGGVISRSAAYRLANGQVVAVGLPVVAALCRVFGLTDPGQLFKGDPDPE